METEKEFLYTLIGHVSFRKAQSLQCGNNSQYQAFDEIYNMINKYINRSLESNKFYRCIDAHCDFVFPLKDAAIGISGSIVCPKCRSSAIEEITR